MAFKQAGMIRYYGFDLFEQENIFHAVLTRQNGISPSPWQSLNFGGTVGDDNKRVSENRKIVYQAFNLNGDCIFDVWQVHGDKVICTSAARLASEPHQMADAIITDQPSVMLLMLFADCVPILLYDPIKRVVGVVHAGWKGTVLGVAAKTVNKMQLCYGSKPQNILAAIGPSIGADHYDVGGDVVSEVKQGFGLVANDFLYAINGAVKFDLWKSNRWVLQQSGVEKIESSDICTACHTEDWFSHRAENGKTGRFGVMIGLRD